jgi:hypothetical protein
MDNNELIGRFDASIALDLMNQCTKEKRVHLSTLSISQAAMLTLKESIEKMASYMKVDPIDVKKYTTQEVFDLDGDLVFIFTIPEVADCAVLIPFGYWKYNHEEEGIH